MFLAIFVFPSCELHSVSFGQFQRNLTEMIFILALWRKARSRTLLCFYCVLIFFSFFFFHFNVFLHSCLKEMGSNIFAI